MLICSDLQWPPSVTVPEPKGAALAQKLCTGTRIFTATLLLLANWINLLLGASKMLTPHPDLRDFHTAWFLKFREERVLFISHQICHWKLCHFSELYFRKITFSLWSFWLTLLNQNQQWGLDCWIAVISVFKIITIFTLFWRGPQFPARGRQDLFFHLWFTLSMKFHDSYFVSFERIDSSHCRDLLWIQHWNYMASQGCANNIHTSERWITENFNYDSSL